MRRGARGNYGADAASLPAHGRESKSCLLLNRRAARKICPFGARGPRKKKETKSLTLPDSYDFQFDMMLKINTGTVQVLRPGNPQAGIGYLYGLRTDFAGARDTNGGQGTEADPFCFYCRFHAAHKRKRHLTGIIGFIADHEAARWQHGKFPPVKTKARYFTVRIVGRSDIHADVVRSGAGFHVHRPVFFSRKLLTTVPFGIEFGKIVPGRLHGPDFVSARGKGFLRVAFHADIDQNRTVILIECNAAGVVMIMAVRIVPGFYADKIRAAPAAEKTGITEEMTAGTAGRFLLPDIDLPADFGLRESSLDVIEEIPSLSS
jgi:hypothetical protein